ncbi:Ribosomal protein S26e [Spraguea lophii 42_110]|uniref:40S ribosomal protein S26 n=1 Tax=Spraguea lophii (strain 42_110) TaxID=1358809 RepID=S7W9M7_SPRLO|nr:Chain SAA, 40S ribosomal protein S26 [Spraguea lophii 42_110]7QJH_RAA Chain RAA, 40S ribosomal protein S26 [Spraguea lophii 42_110]7QJH_SAA Chain SAA, 40S ribosomal protein S26 [Spraguea lophii 42_110]8BR3_SAA Chain SAA, 40S ribosomal protein S26 [Spraguea lophii 42_110]8P5D_SAA Chain SAA, 40S ribosomal protein S26 [Spraguea lophii 42_110]8P60_RAA Chain RAA, 40S ribosomal protein S26 [Spraguea lophii 42_110]8P60_SAA Chain SAA, 40S ribosomal protein S26 [Spraguea lophii 42_110]EPR79571.1 R
MTKKRSNNGRSKKNRGHTRCVRCEHCSAMVPNDKAIKKFVVRSVIDAASLDDLKIATIYEEYEVPKSYYKLNYCVSCAVHIKLVRVRSRWERKIRKEQRVSA